MNTTDILDKVRSAMPGFIPEGAKLSLFGSRARGDASAESDWDFLLLLDKPKVINDDYEQIVYPLVDLGWSLGEYFSVKVYATNDWQRRKGTPFYKNVEQDQIVL
ncbi:MAG: nucleotidyltransferase domain-containing protein [Bacteroidales bacterium]|nr:nucleotidyltransferase domain-containing protein [Bacteroidales bacterium]